MKVRFFGTGTSTGVPEVGCHCKVCISTDNRDKRLRASVYVEVEGLKILIDAGPDLRQQLLKADVSSLSAVLLTHEHYDHVGGLDDVRPLGETRVYAEERVLRQLKKTMPYCFATNKYPGVPNISLTEISEQTFNIEGVNIQPIRVFHAKLPILGFRIRKFAYLTDLKTISEESIEKLKGLDVLVLNALREKEHTAHIHLDEALKLSEKINAAKTYFTHFSHGVGLHAKCEKLLPDNAFMSYDGLELSTE